jgi:hypothetical protein
LQWLAQQMKERGLKAMAALLDCDTANLAKVVAGKRRLSTKLRKGIGEQMDLEGHGSA